jgi:hemoglobin
MNDSTTLYHRVGGRPFFEALTKRFYEAVRTDDVLRPLYPADDEGFEAARRHLELFLVQYWGGPDDYNETRGAPRLRMRHVDFAIGQAERDAWVAHMTDAVRAAGLPQLEELQMVGYFTTAATHLINRH